jgi:hypothetical protein
MVENPSKHTYIVVIDKATLESPIQDPDFLLRLASLLMAMGKTMQDGIKIKDGLYFKKEVIF